MTDDVRKLLGGYATGTLTEEEKRELFEAALRDDVLFAVLSDEQALKDVLDDPAARAQALQAADTHRFSIRAAFREWFERPRSKALAAIGAVLVMAVSYTAIRDFRAAQPVQQVAELRVKLVPAPQVTQTPVSPAPSLLSAPSETRRATAKRAEPRRAEPPRQALTTPEPKLTAAAPEAVFVSDAQPLTAPPAAAPAGAVPPIAAGMTRVAAGGSALIEYSLLKRMPSGEFQAVPFDAPLRVSDELRLHVKSNESGFAATAGGSVAPVEPGQTVTLTIPAGVEKTTLTFRPSARVLATTLVPQSETAARAAEPRRRAAAAMPSAPSAMRDTSAEAGPAISIEIPLKRGK
jgi:hypothetical protein